MSLALRLFDKNFDVREECLVFLHCKSRLSEKSLNETLLGGISKLKLDISDYREQGYDEAAVVSRSMNSMAAYIINQNAKPFCQMQITKLKDVWIERGNNMNASKELFNAIFYCLEKNEI